MSRIRRGWDLTKKAWGVVRENPGLLKLPIYGGLIALVCLVVLCGPGAALIAVNNATTAQTIGGAALVLLGAYLASFAVIYFNVALAAAADSAFRTGRADPEYGLSVARQRVGVIAKWAAVSGVVSLFFTFLRDRGGLAGQIVAALGGALWALVTFLVIPVLAFEDIGPFAAIKRSTSLFRARWGQQIAGNIAIGVITGLAAVASLFVLMIGVFILASGEVVAVVAGGGLALLGLVGLVSAIVVSGAVRGVFGVALYHYVASDQIVGPFTSNDLESAVKQKKKGGLAAGI